MMNIMVNVKELKKMAMYLSSEEVVDMIVSMVKYAEEDVEPVFYDEKMELIWGEVQPYLDKSKNNYREWLKKQNDKKFEKAMKEIMRVDAKKPKKNNFEEAPF